MATSCICIFSMLCRCSVSMFCVMVVMVAIYAPSLLQRRKGEELGEAVEFQNNERKEGETA